MRDKININMFTLIGMLFTHLHSFHVVKSLKTISSTQSHVLAEFMVKATIVNFYRLSIE